MDSAAITAYRFYPLLGERVKGGYDGFFAYNVVLRFYKVLFTFIVQTLTYVMARITDRYGFYEHTEQRVATRNNVSYFKFSMSIFLC